MTPRVLVIEDDPLSMELLTYLLHSAGCETLEAFDGEQGLIMAHAENPDLVVCDIRLPGMDGEAVARLLKHDAKLCTVPLVAVTAYTAVGKAYPMVGDAVHFLASGFDGYSPKPIVPESFVAQVARFFPSGG